MNELRARINVVDPSSGFVACGDGDDDKQSILHLEEHILGGTPECRAESWCNIK